MTKLGTPGLNPAKSGLPIWKVPEKWFTLWWILHITVYAHGHLGVDNLRDQEKHRSESITVPQCIIDLLWITSISFHKKLSSSLTTDITIVHLVTCPFEPLPFLLLGRLDPRPTWHGIWYGLLGMAWYVVWPGGHGRTYGMAWRTWHGIWYGLADMALYMVCPLGHGMVYGMAWEGIAWYMVLPGLTWHDIWYGLSGMAWYMLWPHGHMVWPGGHGMVYGMAWWAWHGIWYGLVGNGMAYGMTWQAMA